MSLESISARVHVRGPRALVRAVLPSDRAALVAAARASAALHGAWVSAPTTDEAFDAQLARRPPARVALGVFLHDGVTPVGAYNLNEIVLGAFCSAYLGYYAFAGFERRGLMGEGLELVMHIAFSLLGLHRLEANIQPENRASLALVARHGFEREGFSPGYLRVAGAWRDHERWAIRAETWRSRRSEALVVEQS